MNSNDTTRLNNSFQFYCQVLKLLYELTIFGNITHILNVIRVRVKVCKGGAEYR